MRKTNFGIAINSICDKREEIILIKILFHLTCLEQGGAERVVTNLSNKFVQNGYEVVVTTQWYSETEFRLDEKVKRLHVGLKESDQKRSKIGKVIRRILYLKKTIKEENPDIIISFLKKNNYRALLANIGTGIPNIVAVRNDPKSDYSTFVDKILIPLLYPLADGAVFQTEEQKEFFPKGIQKRSEIILNPLHNKYVVAELPEEKEKVVVQSGRLVGFKNQKMLVKAFVKVHQKHPDYSLKFYGRDAHDGTKEILEKLILENDASDYIKLMGASDELEKELPKAEIAAFSSFYEGLPNALIEAMVLGMPVVATDCPCGGPRTLITHEENGLLIPVDDEEAMVKSICRLIEDKEFARKLGKQARTLKDRVNEDATVEQWKRYIDKVISYKNNIVK